MYDTIAYFKLDEYYIHPSTNLLRSKYSHTDNKFDYHPDRFYISNTDTRVRVFPDHIHGFNISNCYPVECIDIMEYEQISYSNNSISIPMKVLNINGMAVCEFKNIKIKVTPDILSTKCHIDCTKNIYSTTNCPKHLMNQNAYCAMNVYSAYIIQNAWRKKKGYSYDINYNYKQYYEHIIDIKGMIVSDETRMLNKYDHKQGTTHFTNRFSIPLVNQNGELFLELNYKKMKFYRNFVFANEYHYTYDNGTMCCGKYIYDNRNYSIYDNQTAYCCKNIEMAMRIQKKWKHFKRMNVLWEIAKYYTTKKYVPANILKYVDLE